MRVGPPVGFARRPDGRKLAYQVLGDADLDLVFVSGYATHPGLSWEDRSLAGFLYKLAAFSRPNVATVSRRQRPSFRFPSGVASAMPTPTWRGWRAGRRYGLAAFDISSAVR